MSKKSHRLAVMSELIVSQSISSQEDLLQKLREVGIHATQSTLSRDIKELGAVKVSHPEKGYVYMLSDSLHGGINSDKAFRLITESIKSLSFSGNICVMKTISGYAKAVATEIEKKEYPFVVGAISGDDNIFIVLSEWADHDSVCECLMELNPEITVMPV